MKGIIFTEFLGFVGQRLGEDMVDKVIEDAALPHGGAYTTVGTYPYAEISRLVDAFSERTGSPASDLLSMFGHHLCERLAVRFPHFFTSKTNLFDFLESVDDHIHVEVRKLYPDANLPTFYVKRQGTHAIDMDYASCRPLEALAEGMIRAAADHFDTVVAIEKTRLPGRTGDLVRFTIREAVGTSREREARPIAPRRGGPPGHRLDAPARGEPASPSSEIAQAGCMAGIDRSLGDRDAA